MFKNKVRLMAIMFAFAPCFCSCNRDNLTLQNMQTSQFNTASRKQKDEAYQKQVGIFATIKGDLLKEGSIKKFIERSDNFLTQYEKTISESNDRDFTWLRYLDAYDFCVANNGESHQLRENFLNKVLPKILQSSSIHELDGRLIRKLLTMNLIPHGVDRNKLEDEFIKWFTDKIKESLEYLVWKPQNLQSTRYTQEILNKMQYFCSTTKEDFLKYALTGRFDKHSLNIDNTIILGEDGGLYILVNSVNHITKPILKELVSDEYLDDKTVINTETKHRIKDKIAIGSGAFGKVRFALSLFDAKSKPGDVICVKKIYPREEGEITKDSLNAYLIEETTKAVIPPVILDIAYINEPLDIDKHKKGYVFMELFPQNTGEKIFQQKDYQRWEFQKPYLIQLFEKVIQMQDKNTVMTDLKPANTLFDIDNRVVDIIDTGGIITVSDIEKCVVNKRSLELTPNFTAPEFKISMDGIIMQKDPIDLKKTLVYSCGKILEFILKNGTDKGIELAQLEILMGDMTYLDPLKRISLVDALDRLKNIKTVDGDKWENYVVLNAYLSKIRSRLKYNRSSIKINEDIYEIKNSLYIPTLVTQLDPVRYKSLPTYNLFDKIREFTNSQAVDPQVMLILGEAGSGKSIVLQQKFIDAVENWQDNKFALPIYLNLGHNVKLEASLRALDDELNTGIADNLKNKNVLLFLDSFDEGLYLKNDPEMDKEKLIQGYIKHRLFGDQNGDNVRVIVCCRSNYLLDDTNERWFHPERKNLNDKAFSKWYIAPLNYQADFKYDDLIKRWCDYNNQKLNKMLLPAQDASIEELIDDVDFVMNKQNKYEERIFIKELQKSGIRSSIDTGYLFYMTLDVLSDKRTLSRIKGDISAIRKKQNVHREYVLNYIDSAIRKLNVQELVELNGEVKNLRELISGLYLSDKKSIRLDKIMLEFSKNQVITNSLDLSRTIDAVSGELRELGKWIATMLHLNDWHRIQQESELFKRFSYKKSSLLRFQKLFYILKLLPLKIEFSQIGGQYEFTQDLAITFEHDTLKNYYLLEAIKDELRESKIKN
jgi:serine/threonine protein kinase